MPCRDSRDDESRIEYRDNPQDKKTIKELEAMLCAILSTLDVSYPNSKDDIIDEAEEQGKIEIKPFWEQHQKNDIDRIREKLDEFSNHELEIIKKLLNKKK